jgi:hypothetical protein
MKEGNVKSFMKKMEKEISHQDTKAPRYTKGFYYNYKKIFSNKKYLVTWCLGGNNQQGGKECGFI